MAAVEAAQLRNRCGLTATPTVARVVALITSLRLRRSLIGAPLLQQSQRAELELPVRASTGLYCPRYRSIAGVSSSFMGRSSARFSLVSEAESTIHHAPLIFTKLRPISKAAKFFASDGTQCQQGHHQPVADLTRSGKLSQGRRNFSLVDQGQSGFYKNLAHDYAVELRAWPRHQCEVLRRSRRAR